MPLGGTQPLVCKDTGVLGVVCGAVGSKCQEISRPRLTHRWEILFRSNQQKCKTPTHAGSTDVGLSVLCLVILSREGLPSLSGSSADLANAPPGPGGRRGWSERSGKRCQERTCGYFNQRLRTLF